MENEPIIIERTYNAPVEKVWQAITNREDMKQWYFDLPEFKPEVGFEFKFEGGPDEHTRYLHVCRITEVVVGRKLSYSWRYEGFGGDSLVTFELFPAGDKTRLILTHAGVGSFPADNPDFKRSDFVEGWTHIIGTALPQFVEA